MGSKNQSKRIQRRMNKRAKLLRKKKTEFQALFVAALVTLLLNTSVEVSIPAFDLGPVTVGPIKVHIPGDGE